MCDGHAEPVERGALLSTTRLLVEIASWRGCGVNGEREAAIAINWAEKGNSRCGLSSRAAVTNVDGRDVKIVR